MNLYDFIRYSRRYTFFSLICFLFVSLLLYKLIIPNKIFIAEKENGSQKSELQFFPESPLLISSGYEEDFLNGDVPVFMRPKYSRDFNFPPKIPHLIHQIWDSPQIPSIYMSWIKTFSTSNPSFQYWFWSFEEIRSLINDHYHDYLVLFDSYIDPISKADAGRYFIIQKFGGFYFDLDMVNLKPLANWTFDFDCLVSEEPLEHSLLVRGESSANRHLLNGFIGCSPGHPFLNLVLEELHEGAKFHFGDFMKSTGPFFFTKVLEKWRKKEKLIQKQKNSRSKTAIFLDFPPKVFILPSKFFFPSYDKSESETMVFKCNPKNFPSLSQSAKSVCRKLINSGFSQKEFYFPDKKLEKVEYENIYLEKPYTEHFWLHANLFKKSFKTKNLVHIDHVVPKFYSYSQNKNKNL